MLADVTNSTSTALPTTPATTRAPLVVEGLTKRYGDTVAVDALSFSVKPGIVTGFLGPNGAGKTTTMRALLGLLAPTEGRALVNGLAYRDLADPIRTVGALIEGAGDHPGMTGRRALRVRAAAGAIPPARVEEVLETVGLSGAADRRLGGYSLGMRQRLGLAGALLGDPRILVLDEPANGLDPEGVRWIRELLRGFADEGRTVLVSSHILAEVSKMADEVVVIHRGRLITHRPVEELTLQDRVVVRSPDAAQLARALAEQDAHVTPVGEDTLQVVGATSEEVGRRAADLGAVLYELRREQGDLEAAFLTLTATTDEEGTT